MTGPLNANCPPSKSIVHVPIKAGSLALGMHGCLPIKVDCHGACISPSPHQSQLSWRMHSHGVIMEASPSKSIVHVPLKAGSLALGMHGCQLESVSSQYLETARSSVDNALNHSTQNTDATLPGDQLCIMADRCPATTCRASSSHDAGTTGVNTVADRCIAPATAPRRSTASPRTTAPPSAEESCVPVAQNQLEKTKENISEPSHVSRADGGNGGWNGTV